MSRITGKQFKENVFRVVREIPEGFVLTYKEVARKAGNERAARAVGAIMKTNYDPSIPCHRVVRSDGRAGGYNRGRERKLEILFNEGVEFES